MIGSSTPDGPAAGGLISRATPWLCVLVAAFVGLGVWRWEFAADDVFMFRAYTSVLGDDRIATNWQQVLLDFVGPWGGNPYSEYYRPLVTLSLVLDWTLFGYDAGANAVVNLLLHLVSALIFHRIALRLLPDEKAAALAALLFVSTPLAQENIAWAVGRCALSNLFALSATLVFLRRWEAGRRGTGLHGPVLLLLVCALMSMESAMIWVLFPTVALFVGTRLRTIDGPGSLGELARLTWPHWLLVPLYMLFRVLVLGSLGGENGELMLQVLGERHVVLPFAFLYEALIPAVRDRVWLQNAGLSLAWHLMLLVPCAVGLWWQLRRSTGPGTAIAALLGFWFLSRIPSVHLPLRENLDSCRLAYYSFPPLALILGMLLSFHRMALLCGLGLVVGSALHLEHRIGERVRWSENTLAARAIMLEEARARGAILSPGADPAATPAFAYLDQVAGISGAPGVHPGDLPLVLYPPLVEERIHGFSLAWLTGPDHEELASAAAIAEQLGGLFLIFGGDEERMGPEKRPVDYAGMRVPQPVAGLEPGLVPVPFDAVPRLDLGSKWRLDPSNDGSHPVLILVAGNVSMVRPITGDRWPAEAYEQLRTWRRLAGRNASYCLLVELRTDPDDPETTRARSELVIGGFNR